MHAQEEMRRDAEAFEEKMRAEQVYSIYLLY